MDTKQHEAVARTMTTAMTLSGTRSTPAAERHAHAPTPADRAGQSAAAGRGRARRPAGRLRLLLDLGLSPGVFYGAQALGAGITASLLAAAGAAGARLVWTTARARRIDALNALMLGSYGLMLLLVCLSRDERVLLARDPATSALAGLVFLASCATRTPALAYLARRFRPRAGANTPRTDRMFRRQTAVWGTALVAESALRFGLLLTLPVREVPAVSTAVEFATTALLVTWTVRYRRRALAGVPCQDG
ncbi:VC0807 family protein [Streptomyces sp. NPDC047017]|uniref:VC0807 family protein n=1 Tax=Streptomyces sp. NPDC047017 TaxID=3155024 RepID=UPI0033E0C417